MRSYKALSQKLKQFIYNVNENNENSFLFLIPYNIVNYSDRKKLEIYFLENDENCHLKFKLLPIFHPKRLDELADKKHLKSDNLFCKLSKQDKNFNIYLNHYQDYIQTYKQDDDGLVRLYIPKIKRKKLFPNE